MSRPRAEVSQVYPHGPQNAEHELKKAYNCLIEAQTTLHIDKMLKPFVQKSNEDLISYYKSAFRAFRNGNRLLAERWARTAKHLSRALWHEAKIAYLEAHSAEVPFLEGASPEEYNLHEHSDTTEDLLNSVATHIPHGLSELPSVMSRYLERGREHLGALSQEGYKHELLRAERIKAAHEYGRVLECMELAYEAETSGKAAA